jgi:Protein of unknown function (DUF3499)
MRICARSGCNSPATATLSYDRIALVAYLVTADDPAAREPGDLCERHVGRLVLPRQWQLDDRRVPSAAHGAPKAKAARPKKLRVVPSAPETAEPAPKPRPKRARAAKPAKWAEVGPSLFDAPAEPAAQPAAALETVDTDDAADTEPGWMPRFGPDTDDDVLDAKTPLLRRAFGGR